MSGPRRDTRGIVDARGLLSRVRFRRLAPAAALAPYVEHYWLIDWDLTEPYVAQVVPHPSVNLVFQHQPPAAGFGELAGVEPELFTRKLAGTGRVCGVQFRPGGFRPFAPEAPVSRWTGRYLPYREVLLVPPGAGTPEDILGPATDRERAAALDRFLLALAPAPDPKVARATALAHRIRTDRTVRRVAELARSEGVSVRSLQRLFADYVGVSPKWVILRYRVHEALEQATVAAEVDWARLAAELGYSDQAHLVRDFTATIGVPPTAYRSATQDH